MSFKLEFEKEKGMSERTVREKIERAAHNARKTAEKMGQGDVSHEKMRDLMIKHAESDKRKGEI